MGFSATVHTVWSSRPSYQAQPLRLGALAWVSNCPAGAALLDVLIFLGQWRCPQWVPSQGTSECFLLGCALFPWLAGALTTLPGSASGSGSMVITLVSRSLLLGEPPLNIIRPWHWWDY